MGGGGSSTRRVTFEADENENITVVKGVRLSDSVIDRMKEPSSPSGRPQSQHRSASGSVDEELKKRIAEELALERARRDSEAQKRSREISSFELDFNRKTCITFELSVDCSTVQLNVITIWKCLFCNFSILLFDAYQ